MAILNTREFVLVVIRMFNVVSGILVEVFPGEDGQVRVFQVGTRGK